MIASISYIRLSLWDEGRRVSHCPTSWWAFLLISDAVIVVIVGIAAIVSLVILVIGILAIRRSVVIVIFNRISVLYIAYSVSAIAYCYQNVVCLSV